ncbi:tetratricopeptide repeat protein [Phycicoccus sp. CSK15P-2]|uniref:tetratricopeptide repeat protein n=1 Tax=Phycicoccus sp. CSK15P-2 TaxID=2807627 RepID=UPI00194E410C|nr:tetratricopeptide repeat protein [Phycicoccus sp. CSK15P-2]MBM6406119.1 tetratricopeptide repeat protein [Phycicoccus sp. CSK15P-2]
MSTPETGMAERYQRARGLYEHGEFQAAAEELSALVDASALEPPLHGTTELRLLLARSYYHSAQLGRAERVTRAILVDDPDEAYANLLLGRVLQRQGRASEAKPHLAMAELLGGYGDEGRLPPVVRDEGVGGARPVAPDEDDTP